MPKYQSIGIELAVLPRGWKDAAYQQLLDQKTTIEDQIGEPLRWFPNPGKKMARIQLEAKIDPRQDDNHSAVCAWFVAKLPLMYHTFKDRVAALVPGIEEDINDASPVTDYQVARAENG